MSPEYSLITDFDIESLETAIDDEVSALAFKDDDALSKLFSRRVFPNSLNSSKPQYWISFLREICKFLDKNESKYERSRDTIVVSSNKSEVIAVSIMASAIGSNLGMAWGALVPFCAAILKQVCQMGIEAFRNSHCEA